MLKFQAVLKKRMYRNNLETQFDLQNRLEESQIFMITRGKAAYSYQAH